LPRERITVEVGGKRLEVVLPAGLGAAEAPTAARRAPRGRRAGGGAAAAASGDELTSPMQGTISKIVVAEGDRVSAGDTIVVLEAMKMEQPLTAHKDGTVTGLAVEIGQTVPAGVVICQLKD
jgi:acetyl-CoA/propionyl-CoA carboxylase biotin carboxyl carrier protein